MKRVLPVFLFLMGFGSIHAQPVRDISEDGADSMGAVVDIVTDHHGNSYRLAIRAMVFDLESYGTVLLSKYNRDGARLWSYHMDGMNSVSELLALGDTLLLAGQSWKEGSYRGNPLEESSLFIMALDSSGNLLWSRQSDTMNGYHAQLAALPGGEIILASYQEPFNSHISRLERNGQWLSTEVWQELMVSDVLVDKEGEVYVAGSVPMETQVDQVKIEPPFSYTSYILKLDKQFEAVWVRYTEYFTFDFHHRLGWFNGEVVFAYHDFNAGASLQAYSPDGQAGAFVPLPTTVGMGAFEMTSDGNHLAALYAIWDYSNPNTPDTFELIHFQGYWGRSSVYRLIGHVPTGPLVRHFDLTMDSCEILAGILFTKSLEIGNRSVQQSAEDPRLAWIRLGECSPMLSRKEETPPSVIVFPNPSKGEVQVRALPGWEVVGVYNELGQGVPWTGEADGIRIGQKGLFWIALRHPDGIFRTRVFVD